MSAALLLCVSTVLSGALLAQQPLTSSVTNVSSAQQPVATPIMAESDLYLMNATVGNAVAAQGTYANLEAILGAVGIGFAPKAAEPETLPVGNAGGKEGLMKPVRPQVKNENESAASMTPGLTFVPGVGYVSQNPVTANAVAAAPTSVLPSSPVSASESLPKSTIGARPSLEVGLGSGTSATGGRASGFALGSSGGSGALNTSGRGGASAVNGIPGTVMSPTAVSGIPPSLLMSQKLAATRARQGAAKDMSLSTPAGVSVGSASAQGQPAVDLCRAQSSLVFPEAAACIVSPLITAMYPSVYQSGASEKRKDYEKKQCIELAKKMLKEQKYEKVQHASELSACQDDLKDLARQKGLPTKP